MDLHKDFEKMSENVGEIFFFSILVFDLKLNLNSGLNTKNRREIFKNKFRKPPPPFLYGNNLYVLFHAIVWKYNLRIYL